MNTVRVKASFNFDGWVDVRGQDMTELRAEAIVKANFQGSLSVSYVRANIVNCSFDPEQKDITIRS